MPETPADSSTYIESYNSFSGSDIRVSVLMPPEKDGQKPIVKTLGNLQTISYSIFREKFPVRALGFVGEKGRSRGTRSIAGSMVFTVFDRHVLFDLLRARPGDRSPHQVTPQNISEMMFMMVDQIPPFDVVINFANEYGHISQMGIYGLEIASEGQVMSVQDIMTENTVQYTASHLSLMTPGGRLESPSADGGSPTHRSFRSIMGSNHSEELKKTIQKTRNAFI